MFDALLANTTYSALLAFALLLIPAIIVHEFGHLLAAHLGGIRILEFGIGLPPRIMSLFHWRGTLFTLNWLPFGGFVRPLGEDLIRPLSDEETERQNTNWERNHAGRAVQEASPWRRIIFFIGGSSANLLFAYLLLLFSALIGIQRPIGMTLSVVEANSDDGLTVGDRILAQNGKPIASAETFLLALASADELEVTVERTNDGETQKIGLVNNTGSENVPTQQVLVLGVETASPADRAGIRSGDRIVAIDGIRLGAEGENPVTQLGEMTQARRGQMVTLELQRGNDPLNIQLTPRLEIAPNRGAMGVTIRGTHVYAPMRLVIIEDSWQFERQPASLWQAFEYANNLTLGLLRSIISLPFELLRGSIPAEYARPVSIVGISQLGGQQLRESASEGNPAGLLEFAALISIALGITNLLPIPALDGGRIAFVLLELLRGKPLSSQLEGAIHFIGFIFLLSVGLLIILNDIANPLTNLISP